MALLAYSRKTATGREVTDSDDLAKRVQQRRAQTAPGLLLGSSEPPKFVGLLASDLGAGEPARPNISMPNLSGMMPQMPQMPPQPGPQSMLAGGQFGLPMPPQGAMPPGGPPGMPGPQGVMPPGGAGMPMSGQMMPPDPSSMPQPPGMQGGMPPMPAGGAMPQPPGIPGGMPSSDWMAKINPRSEAYLGGGMPGGMAAGMPGGMPGGGGLWGGVGAIGNMMQQQARRR